MRKSHIGPIILTSTVLNKNYPKYKCDYVNRNYLLTLHAGYIFMLLLSML